MSQTYFKKIAEDKMQPKEFSFDKENMQLAKKILKIYPKNYKESFTMLKSLSGKTHQVLTGVSLIHFDLGIDFTFTEYTDVSICFLTDEEINKYIDKYKPYDKAGIYGIQDGFSIYVEKINGCFYNVMGFPIFRFHKFYKSIKVGDKLID